MIYNLKDKRKKDKTATNFEISSYSSQHGKDQQNNLQQMLGSGDMGWWWGVGNPHLLLVGLQNGSATLEISVGNPQKFKNLSI